MARIDKTDSAIGVFRAALAADLAASYADVDTVVAVGLNASGQVVKGGGQTGIVGVIVPQKNAYKAGAIVDVVTSGEIVECTGLVAGTRYYGVAASGAVNSTNTGAPIGWTVEADRLVVRAPGRVPAVTST